MSRLLTSLNLDVSKIQPLTPLQKRTHFAQATSPWLLCSVSAAEDTPLGEYNPTRLLFSPDAEDRAVSLYGGTPKDGVEEQGCNHAIPVAKNFTAAFELTLRPRSNQVAEALAAGTYFRSNWLRVSLSYEEEKGVIRLTSIPLGPNHLLHPAFIDELCVGLQRDFKAAGPMSFHIGTHFLTDHHFYADCFTALQLHQLYYALDRGRFYNKLFGRSNDTNCTSLAAYTQKYAHELSLLREAVRLAGIHTTPPLAYHFHLEDDDNSEWDFRQLSGPAFIFRRPTTTLDSAQLYAIIAFLYNLCKQVRYHNFFATPYEKYLRQTLRRFLRSRSKPLRRLVLTSL